MTWYKGFGNSPRLVLVHGELEALQALAGKFDAECGGQRVDS